MTELAIDELIDDVIEREGGYVDHPADRGGPTRWGITEAVARRSGYLDDMRMLLPCDAAAIYKRLYWIAPKFNQVAEMAPTPGLRRKLFYMAGSRTVLDSQKGRFK